MSEELFDLEIKKSFDEEFDAQDIFVSEELISKTMAAIKNIENGTAEDSDNNTNAQDTVKTVSIASDNVTNITNPSVKKKSYKWVSGIAAALVIGVIGLLIFKLGGGIKKNSEYAAYTATESDSSNKAAYDQTTTECAEESKVRTEASGGQSDMPLSIPDEVPAETHESSNGMTYFNNAGKNDLAGNIEVTESVIPESTADLKENESTYEGFTTDDLTDRDDNDSFTDVGSVTDDSEKIVLADIEQIVTELGMTDEKEMLPTEDNMEMLRDTEGYRRLKSYGSDAKTVLTELYEKLKTGEAEKYKAYAPLAPMMNVMYLILNDTEAFEQ